MWGCIANNYAVVKHLRATNDTNLIKDKDLADSNNTTSNNLCESTGYDAININSDGMVKYQDSYNETITIKNAVMIHPDNQSNPLNLICNY